MSAFDPANAGTKIVLSNGNKTMTFSGASGWNMALSTTSKTSGKIYVEFLVGGVTTGVPANDAFGFCLNGANVNSFPDAGGNTSGFMRFIEDHSGNTGGQAGAVAYTDANTPIYTATVNDVLALALDFTAGKGWIAYNNTFGGSPSAGTNPAWTWTPGSPWFFLGAFNDTTATAILTVRPDVISQSFAAPSGFSAWDTSSVVATLQSQICM